MEVYANCTREVFYRNPEGFLVGVAADRVGMSYREMDTGQAMLMRPKAHGGGAEYMKARQFGECPLGRLQAGEGRGPLLILLCLRACCASAQVMCSESMTRSFGQEKCIKATIENPTNLI